MSEWRDSTFGEEIELAYGKALPAHTRTKGIVQVYGSNGVVGTNVSALVDGPGIIVGRKGTVGAVAFSEDEFWPIDTTYYVVNKGGHNWRYLFHLLGNSGLSGLNSHSAVPGLNREDVYSIPVRIPPREVQDQIASALDLIAATASIEGEALAVAQDLLRVTATRLFSAGLDGESVEDTAIGYIPQSWSLCSFRDVREWLQYGTSVRSTLEPHEYPVLRIPNIEAGRVSTLEIKYTDLPEKVAQKYLLEPGDLLFVRTNGVIERLGKCAVYRGDPVRAVFASYLIRARLKPVVLPLFVSYFYASPIGNALIAGRATPAADGKYNLNTGTIDDLPLPLPPSLETQQSIIDVLDAIVAKITLHGERQRVFSELQTALTTALLHEEVTLADLNLSVLTWTKEVAA